MGLPGSVRGVKRGFVRKQVSWKIRGLAGFVRSWANRGRAKSGGAVKVQQPGGRLLGGAEGAALGSFVPRPDSFGESAARQGATGFVRATSGNLFVHLSRATSLGFVRARR